MLHWIPYAMVRVCACFIAGIVAHWYFPAVLSSAQAHSLAIALLVLYSCLVWVLRTGASLAMLAGCTGLAMVFCAGYARHQTADERTDPHHLVHLPTNIDACVGHVVRMPRQSAKGTSVLVQINEVRSANRWITATGKVMVWVAADGVQSLDLHVGDRLLLAGTPSPLRGPANPHTPDYAAILALSNVYHRLVLSPQQIKILHAAPASLYKKLYIARDYAAGMIRRYVAGSDNQAIALALTLGISDVLDPELQQAYSTTGTTHVLAVSGLHVGILYGLLVFLLSPLQYDARSRWLMAALSIALLWIYAVITGLSASVLRAVTMFSFIAAAKPFGRTSNLYNTLALSAFILLLAQPSFLFMPGFQLSYLAVLGIVALQRPIANWWKPRQRILHWLWQACAVSIAAQLATAVPALYYFHQFPVWFLVANLIVVPISSAVLVLGLALVAVGQLHVAGQAVGWLLTLCVRLMNGTVQHIEEWPGLTIDGVFLTPVEAIIAVAVLGLVCAALVHRRLNLLYPALVLAMFFSVMRIRYVQTQQLASAMTIHSIPGKTAITFTDHLAGTTWVAEGDTLTPTDRKQRIAPNLQFRGVDRQSLLIDELRTPAGQLIRWKDMLLLITDEKCNEYFPGSVDYLVFTGNCRQSASYLRRMHTQHVIIGGGVPLKLKKQIAGTCDSLHVDYQDASLQAVEVMTGRQR